MRWLPCCEACLGLWWYHTSRWPIIQPSLTLQSGQRVFVGRPTLTFLLYSCYPLYYPDAEFLWWFTCLYTILGFSLSFYSGHAFAFMSSGPPTLLTSLSSSLSDPPSFVFLSFCPNRTAYLHQTHSKMTGCSMSMKSHTIMKRYVQPMINALNNGRRVWNRGSSSSRQMTCVGVAVGRRRVVPDDGAALARARWYFTV